MDKIKYEVYEIKNYITTDVLGQGQYGKVFRAYTKDTRKLVAIKRLERDKISQSNICDKVKREKIFLEKLKYKNIVKYVETISRSEYILFVIEYLQGFTLFEYLKIYRSIKNGYVHQNVIQYFLKQIVEGVNYMYQQNCMHRNLKLDNIMVSFEGDETLPLSYIERNYEILNNNENNNFEMIESNLSRSFIELNKEIDKKFNDKLKNNDIETLSLTSIIKIIDLGFVRDLNENSPISFCGNTETVSPELFNKNREEFSYKCDIWAIGAIAYKIIMKYEPFCIEDPMKILNFQKKSAFKFQKEFETTLELIDFIDKLLVIDLKKRMDWPGILNHPFIVKNSNEFSKIRIIMNEYDYKTIDNTGLSLVEVIDKYKQRINFNNRDNNEKTLKQLLIEKNLRVEENSDIQMNLNLNINDNFRKFSDLIDLDYFKFLYSDLGNNR